VWAVRCCGRMWTDITLSDGQIGDADVGKADEPGNKYTLNTVTYPMPA